MSPAAADARRRRRFSVDAWDPSYGTSLAPDLDAAETTARVDVAVEQAAGTWRAVPAGHAPRPSAVLFVDGVRRVDARVWFDSDSDSGWAGDSDADEPPTAGWCASYAAGVVCCCVTGAHLLASDRRRGLFTISSSAVPIQTSAGTYEVVVSAAGDGTRSVPLILNAAVQRHLADLELVTALTARTCLADHGITDGDDLLVVDGPLQGRGHLPRALGFVKTHRAEYLKGAERNVVGRLAAGERTPVFLVGTHWDRYTWYLRLPGPPGAPWAGVARVECSADLPVQAAVALADLSQAVLVPFASTEYKDARAPQNLYPIGGLERELRRRLGDPRTLYRALRVAAAR